MNINVLGAIIHILGNYFYVIRFKFGVVGSGMACTTTNLFIYGAIDWLIKAQTDESFK